MTGSRARPGVGGAPPGTHTAGMRNRTWLADVGTDNAAWLANDSRTAFLAREYRPHDLGDGRIAFSELALGASRELGEEEDGCITDDADGLRIWIGDDAYELEVDD